MCPVGVGGHMQCTNHSEWSSIKTINWLIEMMESDDTVSWHLEIHGILFIYLVSSFLLRDLDFSCGNLITNVLMLFTVNVKDKTYM